MQGKLNFEDNKEKFHLAFSKIFCNSTLFKAKIFEFFNYDIEKIFLAKKEDLIEFSEYNNVSIPRNFLSQINALNPDEIYNEVKNKGTKFITYDNELYPKYLKNIEDFPLMLYYKGSFEGINFDKTLGVVGSRKATEGAKLNIKNIVSGLKNADVTIVSGLAEGIDSAAHRAALDNGIKTVGVIGSGFNYRYPAQNKSLYDEIEAQGGIIFSEFPDETPPKPFNFPQRNRIITGLSIGVLIGEARMKSGAMVSARLAIEQGRELMCIPGLITNPNCEGIYHLIKQGASIVVEVDDILNNLNWEFDTPKPKEISLSGIKKDIYEQISLQEISSEGLKQNLDVDINELLINLTELELDGLIIQKNGFYYITGN